MAGAKYVYNNAGEYEEKRASQTSAGGANAGDIIAADDNGYIALSWLPPSIGTDTAVIQASETIGANKFVNVHDVGGAFRVRLADASTPGKQADGFCTAGAASAANATIAFQGLNVGLSSVTPGELWLSSSTPGGFQTSAPTAAGTIQQKIGVGVAANSIFFQKGRPTKVVA